MSTKESKKARRQRNDLYQWLIPAILILVVVIITASVLLYNSQASQKKVIVPATVEHPMAKDTGAGDPNAKVKVFAFEDFQCPICGEFTKQLEPLIMAKYVATGKVYYQFSPFSFIGPESITAAEAGYCAMDQGKFWEYHDMIFANQNGENKGAFNDQALQSFAQQIGLNTSNFNGCLSSHKYAQKVKDDKDFAVQSGATGSPYFLVNGKLVGQDQLAATIDAALAGK